MLGTERHIDDCVKVYWLKVQYQVSSRQVGSMCGERLYFVTPPYNLKPQITLKNSGAETLTHNTDLYSEIVYTVYTRTVHCTK